MGVLWRRHIQIPYGMTHGYRFIAFNINVRMGLTDTTSRSCGSGMFVYRPRLYSRISQTANHSASICGGRNQSETQGAVLPPLHLGHAFPLLSCCFLDCCIKTTSLTPSALWTVKHVVSWLRRRDYAAR
jgi:hypothetical protein